MPISITTARGRYNVEIAAPLEISDGATLLTLALERADGIERVVMRCRIAPGLVGASPAEELVGRVAGWIERDFETIREAALKTIRSERRLHEFSFDAANRGPF